MPQNKRTNRGNAFLFIFLGVFLFGALMFTLTRSAQTTSTKISNASMRGYALEIIAYANALSHAVERVQRNGVGEADISFENSTVAGYDHVVAAPAIGKIFDPSGGALTYRTPKSEWLDSSFSARTHYGEWYFPYTDCVFSAGTGTSAGTCNSNGNQSDLMVILPYLRRDVCIEINKITGFDTTGGTPPQNTDKIFSINNKYRGVFAGGTPVELDFTQGTSGCIRAAGTAGSIAVHGANAANSYHFFHVLLAR